MIIWFSEPTPENPTLLKNGQACFDWVSTSTHPKAMVARSFLNFNLNCLPLEAQRILYSKLKTHWQSTFFEIVVGRTLQALGAKIVFEQEIPSRRTPDFHAEFKNQTVIVEAVSPQINQKDIKQQSKSVERLEGFIEAHTPQGYSVLIGALPDVSGNSSLKPYKEILIKLLNEDISEERFHHELTKETELGLFDLNLIRREPGEPVIIGRPGATYFSNAVMTIQAVLKKKKKQVQGSDHLRVLAIHGDSQCTTSEMDQALFGQKVEHATQEVEFIANGKFGTTNTFDGVLFFEQIGYSCPNEPILYRHPHLTRYIPQELESLRQRILVNRKEIKELEPKSKNIMAALVPFDLSNL